MKKYLLTLTLLIIGLMNVMAESKSGRFYSLSTKDGFDYTFVSPTMLKMMGDKVVNTDLNIKASDISSIETISTRRYGLNEDLWSSIRSTIKDRELQTLTTNSKGNFRYDVLGKVSKNQKYITRLMVITQNTGNNVSVVYIEGKIPLHELRLQL